MVFTEQQLQVKKLVDVQQDIEIDALNDGVGALSSTMQNGFTQAANNFSDIQNSLESMNNISNDRYNGVTASVNALSNAMTQGLLDMGNTVANVNGEIQGQLNDVNNYVGGFEKNVNAAFEGVQNTLDGMENDYLDRFNQVNANISDSINNFNEQITNELSVNVFSADTMIYNVSATPVHSLTALGYDSNGKVIPVTVIANSNLHLPPSANYIYTDSVGTPYAGMADTAVSTNENLVTSHAVYNEVKVIKADLNALRDGAYNSFGDIQNQFNDVNNIVDNLSGVLGFYIPMNYMNSTHPVNYRALDTVVFTKGNMGNLWSESSLFGDKYYDWNSTTNTLTFSSLTGIIVFNSNMSKTFYNCYKLNQSISILNGVTDMSETFAYCSNLNQTILIPNSVTNMSETFSYCFNLNQNILISNSVTDMSGTFYNCYSLNQSILIPNSVTNMSSTFYNCNNLNQNILIPNSVTGMSSTFSYCSNLNQNIPIPNSVTDMGYIFAYCYNLNQDIYIYSDKLRTDALKNAFRDCSLLKTRNIHIRSTIPMSTSNYIYNALVNNNTGVNWTGRIYNDLPEPTTWPPAN